MSIEFLINFAATPGDRMFLIMDIGRPCVQRNEIAMSESGGERWKAIVEIQAGKDISYCFQVRCANGQILHEAGCPRRFVAGTEDIRIHCSWQGYDTSAPLLTDAFTKIFFPHPIDAPVPQDCCRHAVITVTAPAIQAGKSVFICGACDVLGKWDTAKALKMKPCGGARWAAGVPVRKQGERLVFRIENEILVKDTLFRNRKDFNLDSLAIVPFSQGDSIKMQAVVKTVSGVKVPLFEASLTYKSLLKGMDNQLRINLDAQEKERNEKKYGTADFSGLKVGSVTAPNNNAGNWE